MSIFFELSLILVIATLIALVMQMLRQPLIVGHILTGILVGPLVLNLIHAQDTIEVFSKLGITTLLFLVGLSLSPYVLKQVGRASLVAGLGQIIFTALIGFFLSRGLGFLPLTAIYIAAALTFSSTIIVLKLLSDKRDTEKLYGKIAIGMLLIQDLIASLLLIFISTTAQGTFDRNTIFFLLGNVLWVIAVLYLVSKYALPALVKLFAASQEFLFLFSIGWGLGLAALFSVIGFTPEIGALVAGITLAASPYHYEINAKMKLLRDFFLVLFFVLLGSQLTFAGVSALWFPMIVFSAYVIIGNPLIAIILMSFLGYNKKTSFFVGVAVAQVSEFSLLLVLLGIQVGHLSSEILPLITVVALISIASSTYLVRYASAVERVFAPFLRLFERRLPIKERGRRERFDILLFGCHRVGSDFLVSIRKSRKKYIVIDFDPEVISRLSQSNIPCRYGDAEDNEFLDELNFKHAQVIISTLPDFSTNAFILSKARKAHEQAIVILMAHSVEDAVLLYDAGATYVVMPHFLGGNYASLLIDKYGTDPDKFIPERKKHLEHLKRKVGLAVLPLVDVH
ncbi:sodium:proton exchanger [Candidatus Uhrbacteria bacterium]|nr:sodium:proton exchanger [Candidatus Uhrbacteria bacterium]